MRRVAKIITWTVLPCAMMFFSMLPAFATSVPVADLDLGDYLREMEVGTSQLLSITVIPLDASDQPIDYFSSNSTVASVNAIGRVSAMMAGQTVIIVSCGGVSRQLNLTVKEKETTTVPTTVRVNDLDLGDPQRKMTVGETQVLSPTVIPTNATNQNCTFNSSNPYVAEVNAIGRITAKRAGTVSITITCDGVSRSFQLTVANPEVTTTVRVTDLDLGDPKKKMTVGDSQVLSPTLIPINAMDQSLQYSSSNPVIAEVNAIGRITAIKAGTSTITVRCGSVSKSFVLEVVNEVLAANLDLGEPQKEMAIGSSQVLSVTVIPLDTKDQKLTYTSSNPQVASINEIGRITALMAGETVIAARCGNVSKTFLLKVVPIAIELEDYKGEVAVNEILQLIARVTPSSVPAAALQYKSSNLKIATVSSSGEVKGISPGLVTITLTTGEIKKEINLIVNASGKRIELNNQYIILKPGESFILQANLVPKDAKKTIEYKSFNPEVATVAQNGQIVAQSFGATTILVSTNDIGVAATVIVNQSGTVEKTISNSNDDTTIATAYGTILNAADYPVITKEMLKQFYDSGEICTVLGDGYQIIINGKDINDINNELLTAIVFTNEKNGKSFVLNNGNPLCGIIFLKFEDEHKGAKHLYLYDDSTGKYHMVEMEESAAIQLDVAGKYLLAERNFNNSIVNGRGVVLGVAGLLLVGGLVTYILKKKRHLSK